ncbi:MAG: beta-galactosidase [Mariniblastus sp.]
MINPYEAWRRWLLFVLAAFMPLTAVAQDFQPIKLQSKITQIQPMTGIVLWSDNFYAEKHPAVISLEYRYCGYNEVVNSKGEYDFSILDRMLDEISKRNHQAVLRFNFCYVGKETTVPEFILNRSDYEETIGKSEGKKTHFCDWSNQALQEFTLEFYTKLAERYDNDPRIAFLQTGFGLWAEYHIYDGPRKMGKTFPSKGYQAKFLRHIDQQFTSLPWSISIDSADNEYSPLEDNEKLLALEFGVFDDSFLCKPHPKENAVNWEILGPERWQRQPGGGEFSYYNMKDQKKALSENGPNGVSFEKAAKQFHITYMIGNDQPQHSTPERIMSAGMATGYRFRVVSATTNGKDLRIKVTNDGVAPIYRDAFFAAGAKRAKTSLRGLLPGQTLDCTIVGLSKRDIEQISIQSDSILPTQKIEFNADL